MRTAVFVRGHARTWCLTKFNILSLFSSIYPDCDWYFAFVKSNTIDEQSLRKDLNGYSLKSVLMPDEKIYPLPTSDIRTAHWNYYNPAYWRIAWLDWLLNIEKRACELESKLKYDNVLFIRPDCWYFDRGAPYERATVKLGPMAVTEIGNSSIDGNLEDWYNGDLIWRTGSIAADIMSLRYLDTYFTEGKQQTLHGNSHTLLSLYQPRNYLISNKEAQSFMSQLIRPDHADNMPWTFEKYDQFHNDSRIWHQLSVSEKITWCYKLGIDPKDYQLED